MKTELHPETAAVFHQKMIAAVSELKRKLRRKYERTYPGLGEIIRLVVEEEEAHAQELSMFPHLLLPDLVDEHIERLGLRPVWADFVWDSSFNSPPALAAAC